MRKHFVIALTLFSYAAGAQNISTIAGTGTYGYSGDGGPATAAKLGSPYCIRLDASGNIYIADFANNRVRKINSAGIISTIAGTGTAGYSGDGGPATAAELHHPTGLAIDASGNIYVSDAGNNRVRKISSAGTISTIAGNGTVGYTGDGAAATAAQLNYPTGLALDAAGTLFIADNGNNCVRKVTTAGIIQAAAGIGGVGMGGASGDGGPATNASLWHPNDMAFDASGNLYILDGFNRRVRMVNGSGTISTFAGNSSAATANFYGDGGLAKWAHFVYPYGIAIDAAGNVYIADEGNNRIRKINTSGTISTYAGIGLRGHSGDGGPAVSAKLYNPISLAVDATGALYIAENGGQRIRKVQ
jgi:sugar lactone lactonase YvrE